MAQKRYFNYKDDDSTFDFNQSTVGIIDAGRYRGFEFDQLPGLSLNLIHTDATGIVKVALDGVTETTYGLWVSRQGTIVTEDATIVLPIAAGDPSLPRIDLIVGQHKYDPIIGGAVAVYVVITGTPSATPSEPALTIPTQQTIIGRLYVPASMTSLTDAGVTYTPAPVPDFGGDTTIAHTEREQIFTAIQTFSGTAHLFATTAINGSNQFVITNEYDCFVYAPAVIPATNVRTTINGIVTIAPVPSSYRRLHFYTPYPLLLTSAFVGAATYIEARTWFTLALSSAGVWTVSTGGTARLGGVNKFQGTQVMRTNPPASVFLDVSGRLGLPANGNIVYLNNDAVLNALRAIQTSQAIAPTASDGGGILELIPNSSNDLTIYPFDFSFLGYKPIWTPNGYPIHHRGGSIIRLVEDLVYWRVQSWEPAWTSFIPNPINVVGGTVTLVNQAVYYRVTGNTIEFTGWFQVTCAGTVTAFDVAVPSPYVMSSNMALNSSPVMDGTNIYKVYAGTTTALRFSNLTGNFPNATVYLSFNVSYVLQT